jgi:asparagine synthase (glutamine-hydrolysing)
MLQAMATRGPHGSFSWSAGPAAIGFLAFHTTPEALLEQQPYVDRLTGSVIALDGRLDNRDDLGAALSGDVSAADGDAAYLAAAYRRWGIDAFARLVGDFAVVIWDVRHQRLLCARDIMGVRPLCYACSRDGQILVASEARALLATGLVDEDVNDAHALEHLAGQALHRTETLFTHIHRVAPAHVVTMTTAGASSRRFWDFDAARAVRYRDDREYAEQARDLLGRAVRAHARSTSGVGVLLSGGLDSSAVAALAAAGGADCEAFTASFPGQSCDETRFAAAVTAHAGLGSHVVPYEPHDTRWFDEQRAAYRELPDYPNGASLDSPRSLAARTGRPVLLTGVGGDEWFTGSPFRFADWFAQGAYAAAARQFVAELGGRGWTIASRDAVRCGLWQVLPPAVQRGVKRLRPSVPLVPDWIAPEAADRVGLGDRIAFRVKPRPGETFAQADIRVASGSGYQVHSEEMEDRAASRLGVEQRHPFYDRRVIEFGYGLPEEQRTRGLTRKFVLRRATAGLLPDVVRLRPDKAEFTSNFVDALPGGDWTGLPRLTERGWIVGAAVDRLRRQLAAGRSPGDVRVSHAVTVLWMLRAVESWIEQETRRAHVRSDHEDHATSVVC